MFYALDRAHVDLVEVEHLGISGKYPLEGLAGLLDRAYTFEGRNKATSSRYKQQVLHHKVSMVSQGLATVPLSSSLLERFPETSVVQVPSTWNRAQIYRLTVRSSTKIAPSPAQAEEYTAERRFLLLSTRRSSHRIRQTSAVVVWQWSRLVRL